MGFRKTRKLNDYYNKSLGEQKACQTNPMEVNVTTSRNSLVSNVHHSLPNNGLEEK